MPRRLQLQILPKHPEMRERLLAEPSKPALACECSNTILPHPWGAASSGFAVPLRSPGSSSGKVELGRSTFRGAWSISRTLCACFLPSDSAPQPPEASLCLPCLAYWSTSQRFTLQCFMKELIALCSYSVCDVYVCLLSVSAQIVGTTVLSRLPHIAPQCLEQELAQCRGSLC